MRRTIAAWRRSTRRGLIPSGARIDRAAAAPRRARIAGIRTSDDPALGQSPSVTLMAMSHLGQFGLAYLSAISPSLTLGGSITLQSPITAGVRAVMKPI